MPRWRWPLAATNVAGALWHPAQSPVACVSKPESADLVWDFGRTRWKGRSITASVRQAKYCYPIAELLLTVQKAHQLNHTFDSLLRSFLPPPQSKRETTG